MNDSDWPARLERLEAHLAHVERQNDVLNEVVVEQGKELLRLRKQVERISQSFESQEMERVRSNNAPHPQYGRR